MPDTASAVATRPAKGTVGDSYDNAMAESVNGAYKTELVWRSKPFRTLGELELATFQWVSWWNTKRLHASLDHKTPQQVDTRSAVSAATASQENSGSSSCGVIGRGSPNNRSSHAQ